MKTIIILLSFLLVCNISDCQIIKILGTANNTTALLFPNNIVHVDLGFQDENIAIDDIDPNVPNLLKLRMGENFRITTNMLVVTQGDFAYSFEIEYAKTLDKYVHIIKKEEAVNWVEKDSISQLTQKNKTTTKAITDNLSNDQIIEMILNSPTRLMRTDVAKKGKMTLLLKNIFVKNEDLYYLLEISNKSSLDYSIDFYNMFMASNIKKGLKGSTFQDIQMSFDFPGEEIKLVPAQQNKNIILHIKKFTLEDNKTGILEIYEKSGGRHLKLKITNEELLRATEL